MKLFEFQNLTFSYDGISIFRGLNFSVEPREWVGILGPNGCGKTTLLKLLTGVLRPNSGHVFLKGKSLQEYSRREIARQIAVLPQETMLDFPFTALEVVLMGRSPYLGTFQWESSSDLKIARKAMEGTDSLQFAARDIRELSGGERERVFLARALAQEPQILLLDEPTTHLDLKHQSEIFKLLKRLHQESSLTVLVVVHDLNLAMQSCNRVLLLGEGQLLGDGSPQELLTEQRIEQVFGVRVNLEEVPATGRRWIFPEL